MNRLKDISRQDGYPICAETLEVLSENSEMLNEFLKFVPLRNRTAVFFKGRSHLLVCQNLTNRVVKVGSIQTEDFDNAKVVFVSQSHDVTDSYGGTYEDVIDYEVAHVITANSNGEKWVFTGLSEVFEAGLWTDYLPSFEAGLSGSQISSLSSFITIPSLSGTSNVLMVNSTRLRMKLDIELSYNAKNNCVIRIPFDYAYVGQCYPLNAMIEVVSNNKVYPIHSYIYDGELVIDSGRWLMTEGLGVQNNAYAATVQCNDILHINDDIML